MNRTQAEDGLLRPGDTFEKYCVEKLLGQGGMGAVYLVRHNILDSHFALKVLFPDVAAKNKQFVDRFIREAKLACKIKHPNLTAVYDAGKNHDNDMYYIVMEYISGGSVRDLLKKEKIIPPARAIAVIAQVAAALEVAEQHNMVHRDIKPDNIMFAADGSAKLADLGIAKSTSEQDTMLTLDMSVFGTPAYMSPEQALDSRKVDCRADIYSLGIVFYEMLTGSRPYRGDSSIEILSQVIDKAEIASLKTVRPELPDELSSLVASMTVKDLQKRMPSPSILLARLAELSHRPEVPAAEAAMAAPAPPSPQAEVTMPTLQQAARDTVTLRRSPSAQTEMTVVAPAPAPAPPPPPPPPQPKASPAIPDYQDENVPEPPRRKSIAAKIITAICFPVFLVCLLLVLMLKPLCLWLSRKPVRLIAAVVILAAGVLIWVAWPRTAEAAETAETARPAEPAAAPAPPAAALQPAPSETAAGPGLIPAAPAPLIDELTDHAVILLGSGSEHAAAVKKALAAVSGSIPVLLQEAESQYRAQLNAIIGTGPHQVFLMLPSRYAELDMSKSNFEMMIREEAHMLRDRQIPFVFLLEAPDPAWPKLAGFNAALRELCNLSSYPLIDLANPDWAAEAADFLQKSASKE